MKYLKKKQTIYWPHHCASNHASHRSQTEATQGKSAWIQGQVPRQGGIFSKILIPNNLMMKKDLHIYTQRLSHETTSYQAEWNNSSVYCFVNGGFTPRWTVAEHDQKTGESIIFILPQTQHLLLLEDIAECFWYLAGHCQAQFHPWSFCGLHC